MKETFHSSKTMIGIVVIVGSVLSHVVCSESKIETDLQSDDAGNSLLGDHYWSMCNMKSDRGTKCGDWLIRWYFDSEASEPGCRRFWYGGCDGNENNFETEEECINACHGKTKGTDNIVITEDDSTTTATNKVHTNYVSQGICSLSPDQGYSRSNLSVKWYYHHGNNTCYRFWYEGLGGNGNRFEDETTCLQTCYRHPKTEEDTCSMPPMTGRDCKARMSRYYYDKSRGECLQFIYGGCGGNNNNFLSKADCERECRAGTSALGDQEQGCRTSTYGCCSDGVTKAKGENQLGCPNPCTTSEFGCCPDGVTPAQGTDEDGCEDIDIVSGDGAPCDTLDNGCCPDGVTAAKGPNNAGCEDDGAGQIDIDDRDDVTVAETTPAPTPVCRQERVVGPCRASLPRYFYNYNTGYCEEFTYGGCQGNDNNFMTMETCIQTCNARRERELTAAEVCRLPRDQGSCENTRLINIPLPSLLYFYNSQTRRCEEFQYNGCGGNRNRFGTERECQAYCRAEEPVTVAPRRQPVCELTPDLGPCNRPVTKFYFNITTMQCDSFTYGGCLGNHNNFQSEEKCLSYCGLRQSRSRAEDCRLPSETGPCRGNFQRWFYDSDLRRCTAFRYGGCQGNRNNFGTEQECMASCQNDIIPVTARPVTRAPTPAVRDEDVCTLPLEQPCENEALVSNWDKFYYYHAASGECVEVPGSTCNNNRNNFYTREQCESYCNRDKVCQPLTYKSDIRCLAYMERWNYNQNTDACEMFVYGGCGGSANNFDTQEACERKCRRQVRPVSTPQPRQETRAEVCALPEQGGNCLAYIQNWRYDSAAGKCVQFVYGGCGGNSNNFKTQEECERFCNRQVVCQRFEEPEVSCLAYIPRWKYDPDRRTCENFVYSGCGGNANNFNSIEACESKCVQRDDDRTDNRDNGNRVSSWEDICRMQADLGPCKSSQQRWHYNPITQLCETFIYGGCLGNHNNFESETQCMTYCDSSRWALNIRTVAPTTPEPEIEGSGDIDEVVTGVDVCALDSDSGSCRFAARKWFYNHREGQCEEFVYGGCDGNQNRFDTREGCESQCNPRDICMLPSKTGICRARMPRFYFDSEAQDCREFVYGGCQGNANNFDTKDACMTRCSSLLRDRPDEREKEGMCPSRDYPFTQQCRRECHRDLQCPGNKKCCALGCSVLCIEPAINVRPIQPKVKPGYCPPRTDWQGLLGACAPACSDDSSCPGQLKCCHHGCGYKCVNALNEEPYQMRAPTRVNVTVKGPNSVEVRWYDPTLASDQLIRDLRYYTVRYHSFSIGQYVYVNVTDMPARIDNLRAATDYMFTVRVNDPPYLSEWSEEAQATTASQYVSKVGECPVVKEGTAGICVEECRYDDDCDGTQKCCSNGCGHTCMRPAGYDVCSLQKDPGSCGNWTVRWYYKGDEALCDRFWFSQCGGNDNRFVTEAECLNRCVGIQVTTPRPTQAPRPYDCRYAIYNCCNDGYTTRLDAEGTNCPDYVPGPSGETVVPVTPGEKATLTCRYGGNSTWYHDGKLVVTDSHRRVNRDGTLEVFEATIDDDGMYACHVAKAAGLQIYRFLLQVQVPIGILPGPDMIMVKPSHQAFLHCEVYGNPKPSVSWTKNGTSLRSSYRYETFSNGTLLIRSATPEDADSYTCRADNGVSVPVDRTIKLTLREMLVSRIENQNGRVIEGGRIILNCEGKGYPEPTITWEKTGRALVSGGNVFISSNGGLTIRDATSSDTGTYTCIVANSDEKIETSTSVQVVPKVMPDDKCEDKTSLMKCRLIVSARLCGYTMYSKICCNSCRRFFNGE